MDKAKLRKIYQALFAVMLVLIIAVLFLVIFTLTSYLDNKKEQNNEKGDPSISLTNDLGPDIDSYYKKYDLTFYDYDGKPVKTSDYAGKPLAVLYWASWCDDCQKMMNRLDEIKASIEEVGGEFLLVAREGVNDETAATAQKYLDKNHSGYTSVMDNEAKNYSELGLKFVPTILYFSTDGVLMKAQTSDFEKDTVAAALSYARDGGAAETEAFVKGQITTEKHGVAANFDVNADGEITLNDEQLSESSGIMMLYAAKKGDKALFDDYFSLFYPYINKGIIPWRITKGESSPANATLDDLRFLEAMMIADEKWGEYTADIEQLQDNLFETCVQNNTLRDFTSKGTLSSTLTLCYGDTKTLQALTEDYSHWRAVLEDVRSIVEGGIISDAFPLYNVRYDYNQGEYVDSDFIQMNEAMITVYHMSRIGKLPQKTVDYLIKCLKNSPIYAAYDQNGDIVPDYGYESTATYAALVMTGCELKNAEMVQYALWRMEKTRVLENDSPLNGSYVQRDATNYAFDTLMPLLAWQTLIDSDMFPLDDD